MTASVRLSPFDLEAIIDARHNVDKGDSIVSIAVFGSRADLSAKGCDIDLLIEINGEEFEPKKMARDLRGKICEKIGPQKIDLLVWNQNRKSNTESTNKFYDMISQKKDVRKRLHTAVAIIPRDAFVKFVNG